MHAAENDKWLFKMSDAYFLGNCALVTIGGGSIAHGGHYFYMFHNVRDNVTYILWQDPIHQAEG